MKHTNSLHKVQSVLLRGALTFSIVTIGWNSTTRVHARTIKDLLTAMPTERMPLLSKNDRLDFIDYKESNMRAYLSNTLGGKSEMTELTDTYFHITLTKNSEISAKLLYTETGDTLICLSRTYAAPLKDSDVEFFSTKWEPLKTSNYLSTPEYEGYWLTPDTLDSEERANLIHKVDMYTTEVTLAPETTDITYTLHVQVLEKKDEERVTPLIKPQVLRWNGKRFTE